MLREDGDELLEAETRRLFEEIERSVPGAPRHALGSWEPSVDVVETAEAFEVLVDVAGVAGGSLRVLVKGPYVLVAGEKLPAAAPEPAAYHLVERSFGRFARTVRLGAPFDPRQTMARLRLGELRISAPKIVERRGEQIAVAVRTDDPGTA
jgi:HSP20 family protein